MSQPYFCPYLFPVLHSLPFAWPLSRWPGPAGGSYDWDEDIVGWGEVCCRYSGESRGLHGEISVKHDIFIDFLFVLKYYRWYWLCL